MLDPKKQSFLTFFYSIKLIN